MALLTQLTSQEKCSNTRSRNSVVLFNVCLLALPHRHVHLCMVHIPRGTLDFISNWSNGNGYSPPLFGSRIPTLTSLHSVTYLESLHHLPCRLHVLGWLVIVPSSLSPVHVLTCLHIATAILHPLLSRVKVSVETSWEPCSHSSLPKCTTL